MENPKFPDLTRPLSSVLIRSTNLLQKERAEHTQFARYKGPLCGGQRRVVRGCVWKGDWLSSLVAVTRFAFSAPAWRGETGHGVSKLTDNVAWH